MLESPCTKCGGVVEGTYYRVCKKCAAEALSGTPFECLDQQASKSDKPDPKQDDGQTYPCDLPPTVAELQLRDWFAGLAMQGMIAANAFGGKEATKATELAAIGSYMVADAMLTERAKTKDA